MQNAPFIFEDHNYKVITNPLSNVVSYSENPLQHFGVSDDIHFDKLTRFLPLFLVFRHDL